jgi:hypothetical protein
VSEGTQASIREALDGFLAEQRARLSPRTYRKYEEVVELLLICLDGYGPQHLDQADRERWEEAYEAGEEEAFSRLFGPEKIPEALHEFLGYFMVRKVIASDELLRASGTVTKKLARWLEERGLLDETGVSEMVEQSAEAGRDLPRASRLADLLYEQSLMTTIDVHALDDEDYLEDYLFIDRVEPGALWFEGGIGPVPVPAEAGKLAQPGWSVNIVLGRKGKTWHILEVGNVYP